MPASLTTRSRPRRPRLATAAVCALALVAASCSSDADTAASSTTIATTTTAAPVSTTATAPEPAPAASEPIAAVSGLDGSIGEAADLVLSWFNTPIFTEADYDTSFDQSFRDAISFAEMTPVVDQTRLDGPFTVEEIVGSTPTTAQLAIIGSRGTAFQLSISIVSSDDSTMNGLFIGPPQLAFEAPATTDEAIARLEALGTLRVAAFADDCSAGELAVNADAQAPIGSGFKLWVLAAVVDAVGSGSIAWDSEVTILDELDSYRSGITQDEPTGSLLTVRELADRMIGISDNTATNHLMDLVGRDAVEQAMIDSGHSAPERNLPLMDAREFTIVKFSGDELRNRYIAATEAERRDILDNEVAGMALPSIGAIASIIDPLDVEQVEWFASPIDLCQSLVELADDDIATAILSQSPGIPDEAGRWESILFKGGSEPGVLAMAWLTIDSDGNRFVTAGSVANEEALIDEAEAANLFAFLRDSVPEG